MFYDKNGYWKISILDQIWCSFCWAYSPNIILTKHQIDIFFFLNGAIIHFSKGKMSGSYTAKSPVLTLPCKTIAVIGRIFG